MQLGLRETVHHQAIQAGGESGRILRQFAVQDLRLFQQEKRQVGGGGAGLRDRRNQRMAEVDFKNRLGSDAAILPGQQPLKLAIGTVTAGDQARRAGGKPVRCAHVGDPVAEGCLDRGDDRCFIGIGLDLFLVVEQRDQAKVDVALA